MNYSEATEKIENEIIKIRRELHKIPEIGLDLPNTSYYIKKKLEEYEIPYWTSVSDNAIIAEIKGKYKGKCIAIRADMDGLKLIEKTGLYFSSENGNMHACGHDGHMAMAIGAAKILFDNKDKIHGHIKVFFQPGEEYPGGAKLMIEEGCMENPKVDVVIGLHEGNILDGYKKGSVLVSKNTIMASVDRFRIKIIGKGAHGANYSLGVDPITIATQIINNLQLIVSRELPPTENKVLSICQIHGGSSENIIPEEVFFEGTVRTTNEKVRRLIERRIKEVAESICFGNNAKCDIEYECMYPVLKNDLEFTNFFIEVVKNIVGKDRVKEIEKPSMTGDDFSFFLKKTVGTYFFLCNPRENQDDNKIYPHHNSKFDIDESYLKLGTTILVETSIKFLNEI